LKYAILCSLLLGSASVANGQTRMPAPTYNGNNSSGWDNPQTRNPTTGTNPADRVGTIKIMLQAPPLVSDTLQMDRGFGIGQAPGGGGIFGYVGISGGVGYTLTSLFELGGSLSFVYSGTGADGTAGYQFLVEPFVKLNLGPTFKTGALNPFVLAGLGIGVKGTSGSTVDGFSVGGSANGLFDIDIDPGVEWLVGGRWGFDAYIPLQFQVPLTGGNIGLNLGVAYGLVAYL